MDDWKLSDRDWLALHASPVRSYRSGLRTYKGAAIAPALRRDIEAMRSPAPSTFPIGASTVVLGLAALTAGYFTGRWLKRRKTEVHGVEMGYLPDWAVT